MTRDDSTNFSYCPTTTRSNSPTTAIYEQRHPQTAEQTTNFRWQPDETRVLVNTWKENYKVLQTHRSSTVWNSIRNEVNAVNAVKKCKPRTLDQCKDKIRRMKEEYTKAKTYNKDKTNVQNASCFGEQR